MRMTLMRGLLAGAIAASAMAFGAAPAHADACDNDANDPPKVIVGPSGSPVLVVGVDDPLTGYTGVVVVCVDAFGRDIFEGGGGVWPRFDSSGNLVVTVIVCNPTCHGVPPIL